MTEMIDALDDLFVNAETIIQDLGDTFTFQGFLRRVAHDQQHAYIDLLVACKHLPWPFDQAHQKIGNRLGLLVPKLGYELDPKKQKDETIFGLATQSTVYRRIK